MSRPNKNPLTPDSWLADGMQGANANAVGVGERKPTPEEVSARLLALVATCAALEQLDRCALATDEPIRGTVEAADCLDAARAMLAMGGES